MPLYKLCLLFIAMTIFTVTLNYALSAAPGSRKSPFAMINWQRLWPFAADRYQRRKLLTNIEIQLFERLKRATPQLHIFPQVSLGGIIEPIAAYSEDKRFKKFAQVAGKRVDFLITDRYLNVICIIELDDSTHNPVKDKLRDSWTASAGIRTIRWQASRMPSVQQISNEINTLIHGTTTQIRSAT